MPRTKKPKLIIRSRDIEKKTPSISTKRRESKSKKRDVILKEILEDTIQDSEVWFKVICDDANTPVRWVKGLDLPAECVYKIDEYMEKKKAKIFHNKKKRPHIHPYMLRSGKPTPPDPERIDRTKQLIINSLLSLQSTSTSDRNWPQKASDKQNENVLGWDSLDSKVDDDLPGQGLEVDLLNNSNQSKASHPKSNVSNLEVDDGLPDWSAEVVDDDLPGWNNNQDNQEMSPENEIREE
ncbi:11822_t:CDS:2 [Ambispora gerdemannii]|uniref:11822_t:CDS:1 n=1 Tax=Ambispora gerdemannii TaxID=144530 RepID=A0A9N9D7E4_9GLOM|nr:11822_t:CDS:2 [Ambispora gerdemannii]